MLFRLLCNDFTENQLSLQFLQKKNLSLIFFLFIWSFSKSVDCKNHDNKPEIPVYYIVVMWTKKKEIWKEKKNQTV